MYKKCIIFSLIVVLFGSCDLFKEEFYNCGGFVLELEFSINKEGVNKIVEEVQGIWIYAFDERGILVNIFYADKKHIAQGYIELDLPSGNYTFVLWGSSEETMNGYEAGCMSNWELHTFTTPTPGITSLETLTKMMTCQTTDAGKGDVVPTTNSFDNLYYAIVENVQINRGKDQRELANLIEKTNTLIVTVTGLQHLSPRAASVEPFGTRVMGNQPLQLFVTAKNERYDTQGNLDATSRLVRYEPPYTETPDDNVMQVNIKMQQMDYNESHPALLYLYDGTEDTNLVNPFCVINAIKSLKDDNNAPVYPDKTTFDLETVYYININLNGNLKVTITINEWELVLPNVGVMP